MSDQASEIDVSVVIVNWNTRDLLLDCIRSIVEGTRHCRYEIIVVDNASSDGSFEALAEHFPTVRIIRSCSNLGFAAANNLGIRASAGCFVCLSNSDIKFLDGCLDQMVLYMKENGRIAALGPQILDRHRQIQHSCAELPTLQNTLCQALLLYRLFPRRAGCRTRLMRDFDHQSTRVVPVLSGCLLMVRRVAMERVGLLDERFYIYREDVDWCKRFSDAGWTVLFNPHMQVIHYGGASSAAAPARFLVEMEEANWQYWGKHHRPLAALAARLLTFLHYGVRILGYTVFYAAKRGAKQRTSERLHACSACLLWASGVSRAASRLPAR